MVALIKASDAPKNATYLYTLVRVAQRAATIPRSGTPEAEANTLRRRLKPFAYSNDYAAASSMMRRSSMAGLTARLAIVYSREAIDIFEGQRARGEV